jgi:hypothetical protein
MSRLPRRYSRTKKLSTFNRSVFINSQNPYPLAVGLFVDKIEFQVITVQYEGAVNPSASDSASDASDTRRRKRHHYGLSLPKSGLCITLAYRCHSHEIFDSNGKVTLPDALMDALHWRASDSLVGERRAPNRWAIKNMSLRVLFVARARRYLKALANALNDPLHPLERVIIIPRDSYRKPMVLTDISAAAFLYKDGRITEAEICSILESAVRPEGRIKLGSLLAGIGREVGGFDLAVEQDRINVV